MPLHRLHPQKLEDYVTRLFQQVGLNEQESITTSHHLVDANLRGVETHGLQRIPIYIERILKGGIKRDVQISIERETSVSAVVNGKGGIGQHIGKEAVQLAIDKAKTTGMAAVGVYNTNHTGMLAHYAEMAVKEDLISMVTTNGEPLMAPTGGRDKFFSANPVAFAFPAGKEKPFILDMSSSAAARGKLILAKNNQEKIPLGWAIDKHGKPTTDPEAALDDGLILPVGGHKGYGLAFMVDIFSSISTGANWGPHVHTLYKEPEIPQGNGQFIMLMRADLFLGLDTFKERMDLAIQEIREVKKGDSVDRIYIPGEIEEETRAARIADGLPVNSPLMEDLQAAARRAGFEEELKQTYI